MPCLVSDYAERLDTHGALWLAVLLALSVMADGCASVPRTGVRGDYKKARVEQAAMIPFFTLSRFSLSAEAVEQRLGWAESATLAWLDQRAIDVTPPDAIRPRLEERSSWTHFTAGGLLLADLSASFESSPRKQHRETQTELLKRLRRDGDLPSRYVLFGEIVYQTSGTCHTSADDYNSHATVVVADDAPKSLPRPCIVTHFQARLLDGDTGSTVWYNRQLREWHLADIDETAIKENIEKTVMATLNGRDGLEKVIPKP